MCFRNLLNTGFLILTLTAVIATSDTDGTPWSGTYHVISDCVSPVRQEIVSVAAKVITTPSVSFTDFGLPASTLATDMTGTVGGKSRTCRISYGDPDKLKWDTKHPTLFSCFDDGSFVCTVYMKPL